MPTSAVTIGSSADELTPEVLARIPCPVLFLWTDHNPTQQIEAAKKAMTYVRDAEFALIEDSAHWPQWEHPEEFNRLVEAYLTK
jgi:pimeloyl-ACP methyl ester carboxylesterase